MIIIIITLVYKEIEASTKYPFLPNLRVLNSNLKSVFTHHLKFFRYALCVFCAYTVHKGVYEFRVNSNIVRLMAFFEIIMH